MTNKGWALVTGASSGLGLHFSELAARDGRDVIVVARSAERLDEVAASIRAQYGVSVTSLTCDLSRPGAAQSLFAEIRRRALAVDMLINNAGFGKLGYFTQSDLDDVDSMIQTNITALTLLTRLFSADMVESKRGMILNVASLAAYTPGPLMAVYHATKSYVLAFSEAIAEEMRGSGVTVTALVPGITRTGFQVRAGIKEHKLGRAMEAADVAAQGYRAMLSGKTVHVAGTNNRVLGFLAHHAPHSIATRVAHRMQRQLLR